MHSSPFSKYRNLSSSKNKTLHQLQNNSLAQFHKPWSPMMCLLHLSVWLFWVSHKREIIKNLPFFFFLSGLLYLAYVFKIHPCYNMGYNIFSFESWLIFYCLYIAQFVYTFITLWAFGSRLWAIVNNAPMSMYKYAIYYMLLYFIIQIVLNTWSRLHR